MKRLVKSSIASILFGVVTVFQPLSVLHVGATGLPPSAPAGLQAISPTDQAPFLSWDADSSATNYQILRDGAGIATSSTPNFTDYSVTGSGTYSYAVESCNSYGCSGDSVISVVYNDDMPILYNITSGGSVKISNSTQLYARIVHDNIGLKAAEYYVGTDPGVGLGTSLPINMNTSPSPNDWYYVSATFTAPAVAGDYKVGMRAENNNGSWSNTDIRDLMVYDVNGPKVTASKTTIVPSLANGDVMPGLTQSGQTDVASFAFNVAYDTTTQALSSKSSFTMSYQTGTCGAKPVNCTTFSMSAPGIGGPGDGYLVTDSQNLSRSFFEGTASVTINGVTTQNPFRVEAIDGNKTIPVIPDWVSIKIYDVNANTWDPNTQPLYHVPGNISGGTIVIQ